MSDDSASGDHEFPGRVTLTLVRHGQAAWIGENGGSDDPALTELGRQQAARLAEVFRGQSFDTFVASPLARTRETAGPIADALGMLPVFFDWLREVFVPVVAHTEGEMIAFFLGAQDRRPGEWWNGWQGGETYREFLARVTGGLESWLADEFGGTTHPLEGIRFWNFPPGRRHALVVAHAGTCAAIIAHLLGIEPVPWEWERFHTHLAGITTLHTKPVSAGQIWCLTGFSRTDHLAGLPGRQGPLE